MRRAAPLACLAAAALLSAACSPTVQRHGTHFDRAEMKDITPGVSARADVEAILGPPASRSTYGGETWYYIAYTAEKKAFMMPQTTDREVVAVHFDEQGLVTRLEEKGLKDGVPVAAADGATPTRGRTLGFMEQMFGNLGRFNKPAD